MRATDPVRAVVIGAGTMAKKVHYPSLASFPDVEIAAICDLDLERVHATADAYQVEGRYTDYRQMIEQVAPDAVYAIGQPHLMYDIWTWCLEQAQHLYIEKPLGLSAHQARSLAYLAEKHDCITQVSFQRRASPLAVQLWEECSKRGPITHAVCEFAKCSPGATVGPRDHMMDDGVHAIDTLRWMCGGNGVGKDRSEVMEIQSITRRIGVPDVNFIAALLRFDNGATGILLNSWTSGRRIFRVQMHAPCVTAEADLESEGVLYADGDTQGRRFETGAVAGSDQLFVFGGFQAKHREFIDALRSGRQPSSCFGDAVKTMEVADKILAQGLLRDD